MSEPTPPAASGNKPRAEHHARREDHGGSKAHFEKSYNSYWRSFNEASAERRRAFNEAEAAQRHQAEEYWEHGGGHAPRAPWMSYSPSAWFEPWYASPAPWDYGWNYGPDYYPPYADAGYLPWHNHHHHHGPGFHFSAGFGHGHFGHGGHGHFGHGHFGHGHFGHGASFGLNMNFG